MIFLKIEILEIKSIPNIKNKVVKYNFEIPIKKIYELESRSRETTQNAKQ